MASSGDEIWLREVSANLSRLELQAMGQILYLPTDDNGSADILENFTVIMGISMEEGEVEQANRFLQVYVLLALAALGFVGNIIIIFILCTKRSRERCFTNINFLILQLALADFLVVAFCLFADGVWKYTYRWLAGEFMCKFVKFFQMLSLYASTFIITCISLDRCIAILCPISRFDHHLLMKKITGAAWFFAALCSIPQVIIFSVQKAPFTINGISDFTQCVTHGAYTAAWQEPAYIVFTFCVMFAVPLLIIVPSYILIFVKITKESAMITGNGSTEHQPIQRKRSSSTRLNSGSFSTKREALMKKAKAKALLISILVILAFIVCWAPYYVCMIYYVIVNQDPGDPKAHNMFQIIFFFGMSNSVLNPLVYGAFHMARRSQSAWKKWNKRPFASTTNFAHAEVSVGRASIILDQQHLFPGYPSSFYSLLRDYESREAITQHTLTFSRREFHRNLLPRLMMYSKGPTVHIVLRPPFEKSSTFYYGLHNTVHPQLDSMTSSQRHSFSRNKVTSGRSTEVTEITHDYMTYKVMNSFYENRTQSAHVRRHDTAA